VHQYDIVLDVSVINRTGETMQNVSLELATMGDLKLVERPQAHTLAPGAAKVGGRRGGTPPEGTVLILARTASQPWPLPAWPEPPLPPHSPTNIPAVHPRQHQGLLH
jgi:hypothetical protein